MRRLSLRCPSCSDFPAVRHDPREGQHIDRTRAGPEQGARGGVDRGTGGQHVIDQQDAPALDEAACRRGHMEGALQVLGALGACQPDLLAGASDPGQSRRRQRQPGFAGDDAGERRSLVEASAPEPGPVERHRQNQIGVGRELAARLSHHPAQRQRELDAVAVFQAMHQFARRAVEAADGSRPGEDRRIGDRRRGEQAGAEIDGKRRAQALAIGALDEADTAPAGRAQRLGFAGGRLAGNACRRIDDTDQPAQATRQEAARAHGGCKPARSDGRGVARRAGHRWRVSSIGYGSPVRAVDPPLRHGCAAIQSLADICRRGRFQHRASSRQGQLLALGGAAFSARWTSSEASVGFHKRHNWRAFLPIPLIIREKRGFSRDIQRSGMFMRGRCKKLLRPSGCPTT